MNHDKFMKKALKEAKKALKKGEIPVGAVVVCDGKVIGKGHNLRETTHKTTAHAEIIAIEQANKKRKTWKLDNCTIYVTIEPCPMCAGAIIQSRIKQVVYGASEAKAGSHHSVTNLFDQKFRHKVDVLPGVMEKECGLVIKEFFKKIR
jgi:tRNA(adenine34) deaminase